MKPFLISVLLAFALFANPVRSEPHLTETQKTLQAELERRKAVEVNKKKALAQKESQQSTKSNTVKLNSRMVKFSSRSNSRYIGHISKYNNASGTTQKSSTYMGVIGKSKSAHTSLATKNSSTQSLQSIFKNADWGTPTYSSHSVNNRTVRQNQRVATTATSLRPIKQSRQVATTTTTITTVPAKKFSWSGFFKGVVQVAEVINNSMNNTSSPMNTYTPQQPYIPLWNSPPNYTRRTNTIINTINVGNQTMSVGGNHELRTWGVGRQTFGTFDGKKVKMYNFGNFSHGTIGDQKVRCHVAGNIKFCK